MTKEIKLFKANEYKDRRGYEDFDFKEIKSSKHQEELSETKEFKDFIENEGWKESELIWIGSSVYEFRREGNSKMNQKELLRTEVNQVELRVIEYKKAGVFTLMKINHNPASDMKNEEESFSTLEEAQTEYFAICSKLVIQNKNYKAEELIEETYRFGYANLQLKREGDKIYLEHQTYYNANEISSFTIEELEEEVGKISNNWNLEGLMGDSCILEGIKKIVRKDLAEYLIG